MMAFVLIAALMALLTLALLTRPWWRRSADSGGTDASGADAAATTPRASTGIAALTGFVAVVVLAGYALVGAPIALDPAALTARDDASGITAAQIEAWD